MGETGPILRVAVISKKSRPRAEVERKRPLHVHMRHAEYEVPQSSIAW